MVLALVGAALVAQSKRAPIGLEGGQLSIRWWGPVAGGGGATIGGADGRGGGGGRGNAGRDTAGGAGRRS